MNAVIDTGAQSSGASLFAVLLAAFAAVGLASIALALALRAQGTRWRERFGAELGLGLRESFIYLDVDRLFRLNQWALAVAACAAVWLTGQVVAALFVLVLIGAVPGFALRWIRHRRRTDLAMQWPDAVMLIAAALRSGAGLTQAMTQAAHELPAPASRELDLAMREQRIGVSFDACMANLERRVPMEGVSLFVASVRIAQDTGGNLAETLERLGDTLRRKAALEGRIDALTAQGRMQGWVMVCMPLAVGAALFAIEPAAMRPLLTTWPGWLVCAGILMLEGIGLHVIRKIVSIDV